MSRKNKKTAVAAEQATPTTETVTEVTATPTPKTKKGTFGKAPQGKTVADLQAAVVETETKINAAKPKAVKKPKAKAAKKNTLGDVFGFHVAAVARALGAAGWMPADAITAIQSMVPKASPAGIRTYVQAGKHNLRGEPAKLTAAQMKSLKAAATAAA